MKRTYLKRLAVVTLASFMAIGAMTTTATAGDTEVPKIISEEMIKQAEFSILDSEILNSENIYTIIYENKFFDDYGNKHKIIITFEPSYEFKKYLIEKENEIITRRPIEHRETFAGIIGTNTVTRTWTNGVTPSSISFQFNLYTRPGESLRRITNARNLSFSAPLTTFSNPSLVLSRAYAAGSQDLLGEINASVQASGIINNSIWLLTVRVTQSGLIRVYSNF